MGAGEAPARYRVELSPRAGRAFDRLTGPLRDRVSAALDSLASDPRPHGVVKLSGQDAYRLRAGDYRIVYEIHDRILLVVVLDVGHRREVYRKR